jgi:D-glycero-alpha-D-manno-heptose-7-phosphate kinase
MIITRTPFRMSFVGGGSDLPSFAREHGGAVVSASINKYVYIAINKKFDPGIRVSYSETELVEFASQIKHAIVRESLGHLGIEDGVEITSIADIPSKGTGLGSSSAFTVGLIQCLSAFQGKFISAENLGETAFHVEHDLCGKTLGRQDQYASALGGINFLKFNPDGSVGISPVIMSVDEIKHLNRHLIMFYTGKNRVAEEILERQNLDLRDDPRKIAGMKKMVALAYELNHELQNSNIDSLGHYLHENWILKKAQNELVSGPEIDAWYQKAISAGATGGKLLGAGNGGFLLFYAPPEVQQSIKTALSDLRFVDFSFEPQGSQVIAYNPV